MTPSISLNFGGGLTTMWGSLVGSPVFIILMILLGVMIFTLVLLAVLRINMRKRNAESSALRHIILRVTVPKEQLDDEEARKKIDEILAIPEAWWNTLGGMHAQRGM
ncbi:MAG TPA: hypothetical protein DIS62_02515, partial [Candidatus Kerfeldbacteria bacterium]|nr:hypothetical protein [Candidatus Kerfeldbacteria bacterium]